MVTAVSELMTKSSRIWSPTWCAEAEVGSTRSSGKPHLTLRNGSAEEHQESDACQPERHGTADDEPRPAVPELLLEGLRGGLGPAEQAANEPTDIERIQPVAEQDQRGGRDNHGGEGGERNDRDTRVGEGLQEMHREQHHDRH